MKTSALLLILCSLFSFNICAQQNKVKIIPEKLTENIYVLKGQGGNIGIFIGEDGVFMIDNQFAPLSKKILATIKMIMLADDDTQIIPGHGNVSSKKELKVYLMMLIDLKNVVASEIKKRASLEEVKNNRTITESYKNYNGWITEKKINDL